MKGERSKQWVYGPEKCSDGWKDPRDLANRSLRAIFPAIVEAHK